MTPEERSNRETRKRLEALVATVTQALAALDAEMKLPSSNERGQRIARICNALEMEKDRARFYGLGIDPLTGKKRKPPTREVTASPRLPLKSAVKETA